MSRPHPLQLNRPVRRPTDAEARRSLARDLCHDRADKFVAIQRLPLFEVAMSGQPAMHALHAAATQRKAA